MYTTSLFLSNSRMADGATDDDGAALGVAQAVGCPLPLRFSRPREDLHIAHVAEPALGPFVLHTMVSSEEAKNTTFRKRILPEIDAGDCPWNSGGVVVVGGLKWWPCVYSRSWEMAWP
jgi:hypothetical protein